MTSSRAQYSSSCLRSYSLIGGLAICGMLLLVSCQTYAQDAGKAKAAIQATNERFMEAFAAHDATGMTALYTDGAIMYAPGFPALHGPAAIEEYLNGGFEKGLARINLDTRVVKVDGDTAYELGDYALFAAGNHQVDHGIYTVTWELRDGEWKIHRDVISSSKAADMSSG